MFGVFQLYVNGLDPPLNTTVALPLALPQVAGKVLVDNTVNAAGCEIVYTELVVHPLASVTFNVYVPAGNVVAT